MCNSSFVRHEENKEFRIEIKITTARSIEDDVVNVTWFKILYIFLWITLVSALLTAALLYFPYCAFNQTQLKSVNKFELFDDAAVKAVGTTILISLVSFIIQLLLVNSKYSKDIKKNEFGVRAIMFSLIGCFIGCVAFTFSHIDEKTSTDSTSVLLTEPVLVILVVVAKPTLQYGTEIVRNLEIAEDFFFNFVGVLAISVNFLHGKASSYGVLAAFFLLFHKIPYGRFRYFLLPKADWRKPKISKLQLVVELSALLGSFFVVLSGRDKFNNELAQPVLTAIIVYSGAFEMTKFMFWTLILMPMEIKKYFMEVATALVMGLTISVVLANIFQFLIV